MTDIDGGGDSGISTPIQSFIKYFNSIKPYHTKILEVLEQYNFVDPDVESGRDIDKGVQLLVSFGESYLLEFITPTLTPIPLTPTPTLTPTNSNPVTVTPAITPTSAATGTPLPTATPASTPTGILGPLNGNYIIEFGVELNVNLTDVVVDSSGANPVYYVIGHKSSVFYIAKILENGLVMWHKDMNVFGGTSSKAVFLDGHIYATTATGTGELLKIDTDGNLVFRKTYASGSSGFLDNIWSIETDGTNLYMGGGTSSDYASLIKVDTDGEVLWALYETVAFGSAIEGIAVKPGLGIMVTGGDPLGANVQINLIDFDGNITATRYMAGTVGTASLSVRKLIYDSNLDRFHALLYSGDTGGNFSGGVMTIHPTLLTQSGSNMYGTLFSGNHLFLRDMVQYGNELLLAGSSYVTSFQNIKAELITLDANVPFNQVEAHGFSKAVIGAGASTANLSWNGVAYDGTNIVMVGTAPSPISGATG